MTPSRKPAITIASALGALALLLCGPTSALAKTPKLTIAQPAATSDPTPTLSGSTTDPGEALSVKIFKGSKAEGEIAATLEVPAVEVSEAWSATPQEALAPGVYTALAEQEAGALKSEPVTFTIDTKPAASIDPVASPSSDAMPVLTGSAGTAPGDLEEVEVTLYEGEHATGTPLLSAPVAVLAGEWTYAAPHLPDGTYTATATQENEAGETEASAPVTFTVDTTAPKISIRTPGSEEVLSTSTPTYGGAAGSESGDLPAITVTVYLGTKASGTTVQAIKLSAAQWSAGVQGPALANGIYTALVEQADSAGNIGSSMVTFAVAVAKSGGSSEAAPPTASFRWFPSRPLSGEAVSLVSTSTDAGSPITALAWALGPGAPFAAGEGVLTTSFAKAGTYQIRLRVSNAAGLSSVATETLVVSAPPATLMQPFPVVRIAGSENRRGTKVALLTVEAPPGASVQVRCRGRGCPARRRSVRTLSAPGAGGTAVVTFRSFERLLRAGAVLEVRVSKAAEIGKYTRFTVRRGRLPTRIDECLSPDGSQPIRCPS